MDYGMCHYNFLFYPSNRRVPIERRLRQGDSFSSFRFLIAAEDLKVMINALVNVCFFANYQVGRTDIVRISYLQFADDTLLVGNKS
jgi:hypothetical protein